MSRRAQSNVVGVALLVGLVALSLGGLTASIGTVVDSNAAAADAARVADGLDRALQPVEATGVHRGRVSFTDGRLQVVERDLRILDGSGVVRTVRVDGLVFTGGQRRVGYLAGAIVRGTGDGARMRTSPPITASRNGDGGILIVGAPVLNSSSTSVAATDRDTFVLRSNVTHRRSTLGNGSWRVAIETRTPAAWRSYFSDAGASVVGTRDFDDDGLSSLVARFPGDRIAYLVVHDLRLEVERG